MKYSNKLMDSSRYRQTCRDSFKNEPNAMLKSGTFDVDHLQKFIERPKTANKRVSRQRMTAQSLNAVSNNRYANK